MDDIGYELTKVVPVEAVVALYQAGGWWRESDHGRAVIPAMIAGSFAFLVARAADGQFVGMGRVISDGASDAYIQDVVVLPEYRGRGIGRELIRRLLSVCRDHRLQWIGLVAEPGTSDFYQELGFRELTGHIPMRHV